MKKTTVLFIILFLMISAVNSMGPGLENALEISTSAIVAQKLKMNVIADNIANIDSTDTGTGEPYRKKTAVLKSQEYVRNKGLGYQSGGTLGGVQVVSVVEDRTTNFNKVYDPAHPQADENGYVYYPNVSLTEELVEMTQASGAFEGNVVVFNTTKQMMETALELGR